MPLLSIPRRGRFAKQIKIKGGERGGERQRVPAGSNGRQPGYIAADRQGTEYRYGLDVPLGLDLGLIVCAQSRKGRLLRNDGLAGLAGGAVDRGPGLRGDGL